MPPVVGAIGAVVSAIGGAISAVTSIGGFIGAAASFAVKALVTTALNYVASALFGGAKQSTAERQANVLQLTLGEAPAQAIFGRAATGGALLDAFNYGADNEWEALVIDLAAHECDALEGVIINDVYYAFAGDGLQDTPGLKDGATKCVEIHFRPGSASQTVPSFLTTNAPSRWSASDHRRGRAFVVFAYKQNETVFPTGRPSAKWIVRGKKLYDPRKDSTIEGGSGAHRWDDPSTYEWGENASLCEFNYRRGVWSDGGLGAQLMVGPGLSEDEAPGAAMIALINVCDEDVALKAGGTQKRYTAAAVVGANEAFISVIKEFADAMAGEIVERDGAVFAEPGYAKSVVATFTDADLIDGTSARYQRFLARDQLVNTVRASYVAPDKLYQEFSAPLRRSAGDIAADGEPHEATIDLPFVTKDGQAQRCGEIARRSARYQRQAQPTLGPRFLGVEAGDWVSWRSDRYLAGSTVTFRVRGWSFGADALVSLGLREIAGAAYDWTAASDELDQAAPAYVAPGAPAAPAIAGFTLAATTLMGDGGGVQPALSITYTPPGDPRIDQIRFEYQKTAGGAALAHVEAKPFSGAAVIAAGVTGGEWQARAVPVAVPAVAVSATAWATATVAEVLAPGAESVPWTGVTDPSGARPDDNADVTGDNIAAGIDGQAPAATDPTIQTGATKNTLTYSPSAPGSPSNGDLWADTSTTPVTWKVRVSGAWQSAATVGGTFAANLYESGGTVATLSNFKTALGVAAGIAGQAAAATDSTIQSGATKNTLTYSSSAPGAPGDGDLWCDTSSTPAVWKVRVSGAWQAAASYGGAFGATLYESAGGAVATLTNFQTALGVAAGISGQGDLATLDQTDTAQIVDNACTNLWAIYTATGISVATVAVGWTTVASLTVGASGKPVRIDFGCTQQNSISNYRLLVDGSELLNLGDDWGATSGSFFFIDAPSAGAHTYDFQAQASISSANTVFKRTLIISELKK